MLLDEMKMGDVVGEGGWGWVYELQFVIVTESATTILLFDMIGSTPRFVGLPG